MRTASSLGHRVGRAAVLIAVVVGVLAAAAAQADDRYAAIAFSQSTGRWGYAWGKSSRESAENAAVRNARADDARPICHARNWWCALATGDKRGAYGYGYASSRGEAIRIALSECCQRTSNCHIVVCVHAIDGE